MSEKDLPAFQQESEIGGETKNGEKQSEHQDLSGKVKVCDKPHRSCSFVRNWGGWEIGGE